MANKRNRGPAKDLVAALEAQGYEFARVNSSGRRVYTRAGFPDIPVKLTLSEREARFLIKRLERQHGVPQESHKRNAVAVKDRQSVDRDRLKEQLAALGRRRDELLRQKAELLVGDFTDLARADRLALERELDRLQQERREYERLMTVLASPLHNTVTHTAGVRP